MSGGGRGAGRPDPTPRVISDGLIGFEMAARVFGRTFTGKL